PRNDKTPGEARDGSQASARGRPQQHQGSEGEGAKTSRSSDIGMKQATSRPAGARAAAGRLRRHRVCTRPERDPVAAGPTANGHDLASDLNDDPAITVVKTISSIRASAGNPQIVVVETTPERAAILAQLGGLFVEPDHVIGSRPMLDGGHADLTVSPVGEVL